jgi:hypothetical protein
MPEEREGNCMRRRRTWQVAVLVAALAAAGGTALAAVKATTTTGTGGVQIGDLEVVGQTAASSTDSTSFVAVPGASATLTLDDGDSIRARFSGESLCAGETLGQKCSMRVIVIGRGPMDPRSGLAFAFDSVDNPGSHPDCCTDPTAGAHSMEWVSRPLLAGEYTVRAQYAVESDDDQTFTLDNWTFSVEKIEFGAGD